MSLVKKFPLAFISFPNKCVKCGGPFEKERNIVAEKGFDLILYKSWVAADIPVPLCKSCHLKRKIAGIVALPLSLILIISIIFFVAAFENYLSETIILILVAFPSLFIIYFARNKLSPMLDKIFLGIKPLSFYKDSDEVELWFKDGNLACEVEAASLKYANKQTYSPESTSESTESETEENPYVFEGKYENALANFMRPNGKVSSFRLFLVTFVGLSISGIATYYDYTDGDDYYYPLLPIATIILFILTLLSVFAIIINFFKKK